MTRKTTFLRGGLGSSLVISILELLQQCGKRVKTKSQKVFGANSYVCRSYREKMAVGGFFGLDAPPPPILNRVNGKFMKNKRGLELVTSCSSGHKRSSKKFLYISDVLPDQIWCCNIKQFLIYSKSCIC